MKNYKKKRRVSLILGLFRGREKGESRGVEEYGVTNTNQILLQRDMISIASYNSHRDDGEK